jgi:alanine racemase
VLTIDLNALEHIVGGHRVGPDPGSNVVKNVTIHSAHIMQGSVFFALKGLQADGHDFVDQALRNGAVAAVVARGRTAARDQPGPIIEVDDPLTALQQLARWWRSQLSATVVAVIGSSGKTVTKDALVHILAHDRKAFGSPGSFNSKIGVPLALLDCPADRDIAVIEAAATEPGEMALLRDIIRPDHVVFTNLDARHASNFANPEAHIRELLAMADDLGGGWLLVGDQQPVVQATTKALAGGYARYLRDLMSVPVFSVAGSGPASTFVEILFPDGAGAPTSIQTPFEEILSDVELAVAASWLLGVKSDTALQAMSDYLPTATRMEVWQSPGGWTVVRDVATSDAVSLSVALRVSRRLVGSQARFSVVLADALKLCPGDSAQALARAIAAAAVDTLYTLDSAAHRAIRDTIAEVAPEIRVLSFASLEEMRPLLLTDLSRDDIVLIESPRERSLAEVTSTLMEPLAATRLFIDQAALESNVTAFRRLIGPRVQLLAMVKGLAYGTSPVQVSMSLQGAGVDQLGVATADEGALLRRAGVSLPILVTLGTPAEMDKMIRHDLTPQIYSPGMLESVIAHARLNARRQPVEIHLEVETGMHRTGFTPAAAVEGLQRLRDEPAVRLTGIMTHFASADIPEEDDFTRRQLAVFSGVVAAAEEFGFAGFVRHAANTAGAIRFPEARLDMVRIGIGLYGVYPSPSTRPHIGLSAVVGLVSQVVEVQRLDEDDRIGYGGTYRVPAAGRRVAVVAAGYHDCIPRAFSNFGYVSIDGRKCPIVGSVSMDSMVVDITGCPGAGVGSDVLIYGRHGGSEVSVEEVAAAVGTIPYELLTRVGPRVQRVLTQH